MIQDKQSSAHQGLSAGGAPVASKDGDKSFFSRFLKGKEDKSGKSVDAVLKPDTDEVDPPEDPDFPPTQLLETMDSDPLNEDLSQTVDLDWDESSGPRKAPSAKGATDVTTTREPTAVLDVPLSADDGEPTTLRLALMRPDELEEEEPGKSEIHDEVELESAPDPEPQPTGIENDDLKPAPDPEPVHEQATDIEENEPEENAEEIPAKITDISERAATEWAQDVEIDYKAIGQQMSLPPDATPPGFAQHSEALARLLRSCETPMSIAINSPQGSGGSILMKMVMEDLLNKDEGNIRPIWFDSRDYSVLGLTSQLSLNFLLYLSKVISKVFPKGVDVSDSRYTQKQRLARVQRDILDMSSSLSEGVLQAEMARQPTPQDMEEAAPATSQTALMDRFRIVKKGIRQLVDDYLSIMNSSRLVIFIDGLDSLAADEANSFLSSLAKTLNFEKCVKIFACDVDRLKSRETPKATISTDRFGFMDRTQANLDLQFNVPTHGKSVRRYLTAIMSRAGMSLDSASKAAYCLLVEQSIGSRVSDLHDIVNALVMSDLIGKSGNEFNISYLPSEERERFPKALFGLACLQKGFEPVFKMLLEEMTTPEVVRYPLLPLILKRSHPDGPVEAQIGATIRARLEDERVYEKELLERISRRAARFLVIMRNTIFKDSTQSLSAAEIQMLDYGTRLISYSSHNTSGHGLENKSYWLINGFCRQVFQSWSSKKQDSPELHSSRATWSEGLSSYSYKIWHNPAANKAAWGVDRLFFHITINALETDRLSLGLRFNILRLLDYKFPQEKLFKIQKLKKIKAQGFLETGPDSQGFVNIYKELDHINWAQGQDQYSKTIDKCANELANLAQAITDQFDLPISDRKVRVDAPCPKCGKHELVNMGKTQDGTIQLKCAACNAKVASKPKSSSKDSSKGAKK